MVDNPFVILDNKAFIFLFNKSGKKVGATVIDSEDLERVSFLRWHLRSDGYVRNSLTGMYLHSFIMKIHEDYAEDFDIDHRNKIKLDNTKRNLRVCTKSQNSHNQKVRVTNTSGYKGVSYVKHIEKWHAYIDIRRKRIGLGYFSSVIEAAKTRAEAEKEYNLN